jgi:NAD-reducing hydrogenase small subunit
MSDRLRVGTCRLGSCSGCHRSLLDLDESMVDVLRRVDIVFGPLVDAQALPPGVDLAIVEGPVHGQDGLWLARTLRERSRVVVALGDCAVSINAASVPEGLAPKRMHGRMPLHDVIRVDVLVPGCPPKADVVAAVLIDLFEGRQPTAGSYRRFG